MKRTYLFFILFAGIPAVALMAGQPSEDWKTRPFIDFVSRCRDHKPSERVSEYRAEVNSLKEVAHLPQYGSKGNEGGIDGLMEEIAKQGDFEILELLEKDFPPDLKKSVWQAVSRYSSKDDANKLLVKWAKENPASPVLMKYHLNGLNLLIEMAGNKSAKYEDRLHCLYVLSEMPDAVKVLDRIRALTSDQSFEITVSMIDDMEYMRLGSIAARVVKEIERRELQEQ
jgi:hypothetical protein